MAFAKAGAAERGVPLYAHFGAVVRQDRAGAAARADDEHPQRRRARRQQRGLPGVHGRCPWASPSFREGLRAGVEIFHALQGHPQEARLSTGVGDEGGFAPSLKSNKRSARRGDGGHRQGRLQGGRQRDHRARPRRQRVLGRAAEGATSSSKSGEATRTRRQMVDAVGRLGAAVSDHLASRTAWPRATGTAGRCSPRGSAAGCSWSATTSSSPTRRSSGRASTRASATRC